MFVGSIPHVVGAFVAANIRYGWLYDYKIIAFSIIFSVIKEIFIYLCINPDDKWKQNTWKKQILYFDDKKQIWLFSFFSFFSYILLYILFLLWTTSQKSFKFK